MDYSDYIIFIMEILGTIAFASSGAMVGIEKKMDIFGVNVLGITTAVGGGLIRDIILSRGLPAMFRKPVYTVVAVITSTVIFAIFYVLHSDLPEKFRSRYERIMMLCDTVGLGIFTVVGVNSAIVCGYGEKRFLMIFLGVMTGVGGGLLRDVMAGNMPYILVKHVYAVASLAGAVTFALLYPSMSRLSGMFLGAGVVVIIRILAAHYLWNLPRVE